MIFSGVKAITIPEGKVKKITSDGVVLWEAVTSRIPSEYQEVEWIGTDGASYIISNFTINELDEFTLYYTYSAPPDTYHMFGADGSSASGVNSPRFLHRHGHFVYNKDITTGNFFLFEFKADSTFHTYNMVFKHQGNITVYEDGVKLIKGSFYNAKTFKMFGIFCNNYRNVPASYLALDGAKIAEFRFVDDTTGQDVFNPIPCYRKTDGVIGMYDLVRRTFLTNVGSGNFTKGANV